MINDYLKDLKNEFAGYGPTKLKQDIMAGLTVTAVALPLALAFGVSSGANAAAGLITAILAGLVIGSLSGASFQISGPTGAMTAILILLAQKYGMNGIWIAGALSGIILVIAGVLKFGKIVTYIPTPVITGFTSGIAIIIAIGQIDNLFGLDPVKAESSAMKLIQYFQTGIQPNWIALSIGILAVIIMVFWPQKWNSYVPSSLAAIVICVAINMIFKLPVAVIGEIPKTLLPENRLSLLSINFGDIQHLIVPALSIAALGMIESLLCGEVGGKMKGEKLNANRELVSQGIGNIIIPFFGGVPATAAIARSSVAIKAGGQTRLVSVFHSIGLLISMFALAGVMSQIPLAALAGVLMVTAWRMNEWKSIKYIFSHQYKSAILKYLITMIATVVFDLTQAIIIGVAFASVLFVVKASNYMEITIHKVDANRLKINDGITLSNPLNNVRVVYFTGPLFFATIEKLKTQIDNLDELKVLVLSMRGAPLMDTSGLQALEDVYLQLKQQGCRMMISGIQPQVKHMLERSFLVKELGEDMNFWSADQAIQAIEDMRNTA